MYKDVSEELVVKVIKSQNEMIAKIHHELIKIFSSTDNDDLIFAATFHSELHEATSKTNANMICTMYMSSIVESTESGI